MFKTTDTTYGGQKYTGRSRAVVLDNVDPLARGRIRVKSPVLGETVWIAYLNAAGSFSVPKVGDIVYIECDGGYESHPIAHGNYIKGADSTPDIPKIFQRNSPTNRGFFSPGGHLIEIDDGSDQAGTSSGVRITTSGGAIIKIDDFKDTINITNSLGNEVILDSSGIKSTEIAGAELNLSKGKVALGNSDSSIELFDQLVTLLQAFTSAAPTLVSTAVGPGVMNPTLATAISNATLALESIKGSL